MTFESAFDLIDYHYQAEVWKRHDTFERTDSYVEQINEFAKALTLTEKESSHFGVFISGLCGNGKTTLIKAFRSAVSDLDKTYNAFAEDMQKTHKRYDVNIIEARKLTHLAKKEDDMYYKLMDCNILCIDDCGIEPAETMSWGNVMSPVEEILEYRYEKQLFTVITSNLTPPEFSAKYGGRIKSRLLGMMYQIAFSGEDNRVHKYEESQYMEVAASINPGYETGNDAVNVDTVVSAFMDNELEPF